MNKVLLKLTLMVLPLVTLLISINVIIDPGSLFHDGVEEEIANIILDGKRAGIPREYIDYTERDFQKSFITRVEEKKDVIAFGSSRVRYIRGDLFPGKSFHNNAVNAASLEDFITQYHLYRKRGLVPERLVLALDHWILDKDNGYTNWLTLRSDYFDAAEQMKLPFPHGADLNAGMSDDVILFYQRPEFLKWREALSPAYFQASWKRLISGNFSLTREKRVLPTQETEAYTLYVINEDGSFADQKHPSSVEDVRNLVDTVDDGVSPLKEINEQLAKNLERFLDVLKEDGVEVLLVLVPTHPRTYVKWTKNDNKGLIKGEAFFRDLAKRKGLPIVGSYNPANIPADESEFRDWVHPYRPVLERIIRQAPQS